MPCHPMPCRAGPRSPLGVPRPPGPAQRSSGTGRGAQRRAANAPHRTAHRTAYRTARHGSARLGAAQVDWRTNVLTSRTWIAVVLVKPWHVVRPEQGPRQGSRQGSRQGVSPSYAVRCGPPGPCSAGGKWARVGRAPEPTENQLVVE